jgi:hypothetical protein
MVPDQCHQRFYVSSVRNPLDVFVGHLLVEFEQFLLFTCDTCREPVPVDSIVFPADKAFSASESLHLASVTFNSASSICFWVISIPGLPAGGFGAFDVLLPDGEGG